MVFEYVHTEITAGRSTMWPKTHYRIASVGCRGPEPGLEVKRRRRGGTPVELDPELNELPLDERFAAAFAVWTDDADFARYILTPELRLWLLSAPESAPLSFRFEGDQLLCWQRGAVDAEWAATAVEYLESVLALARPAASYGEIP